MLKEISKAMKRGESLKNATTWANATSLGSHLAALAISSVALMRVFGIEIDLDREALTESSLVLGAIWMLFSDMIHTATNKEAGRVD